MVTQRQRNVEVAMYDVDDTGGQRWAGYQALGVDAVDAARLMSALDHGCAAGGERRAERAQKQG